MQRVKTKKSGVIMLLWSFILTIALTFVCVPDAMAAKSSNNSNVKSVKVTNIKGKSLTLKKGNTKTLKVKVVSKNKKVKVPQTVTFQSSAPKVASVTKKGKITAKKAGTSKITVTSKANKKKKVTITVKVPATASAKLKASVVNSSTIKISLPKAKKLSMSNFTVKKKALSYGKRYNRMCKLDNMTTSNNKDYLLVLEDTLYDRYSVQVTVKGVGTATAAYHEGTFKYTRTNVYSATYNENVNRSLDVDEANGFPAFTVKNLPKGIKWEDNSYSISFFGKPSEAGRFVSTITAIDELGNTFSYSVTWLIGSVDKISAAATPGYYVLSNGEAYINNTYVSAEGGSGFYKYELSGNNAGLTIDEDNGSISGTLKAAGTYKLTVNVTDRENPSYKTTAEVVIYVAQTVTINGMVKDLAGNAMTPDNGYVTVRFRNKNKAAKYTVDESTTINGDGTFSVSLEAGTYDIEAYYRKYDSVDSCRRYLYNQKLTASKSGVDLTLPLRKIVIESSDPAIQPDDLGTWYDADGKAHGYGSIFYLKNGISHKWTASNENGRRTTKAEVSFTVNAATTRATAKVTAETVSVEQISLGAKDVTFMTGYEYHYFAFTAPETKTYYFYSSDYNRYGSLRIKLEDIAGNEYDETEYVELSGGNVGIGYSCEADKTYYVGVRDNYYEEEEERVTFKLNVSAEKPVYNEPVAESAAPEYPAMEDTNNVTEVPAESGNAVEVTEIPAESGNAVEVTEIPANELEETPVETEETVDDAAETPVESEELEAEETVFDETAGEVSDSNIDTVQ